MKTIKVPKGVQIACGKSFENFKGNIRYCGKILPGDPSFPEYCKSCQKWNDDNCTKDVEVKG